jgi:hypothetical protein
MSSKEIDRHHGADVMPYKILSRVGTAITFIGDVPPLPEDMVVSTRQLIEMNPSAAKRKQALEALRERKPIAVIDAILTGPEPQGQITDAEKQHYANVIDLIRDAEIKKCAYEALQHRDRELVEQLLKEGQEQK